jgi:ATP-dependent Clp protease protease subunit
MKEAIIRAKGPDITEVLLYDLIGYDSWFGDGISAKAFREQIKAVKTKTISLRINSPGGSVTEASAMLAALDEWPGRIEVDVDGLAASAASFVAMAGDKIRVASNALVMIHDPVSGVRGGADEMRRTADLLDKVKGQIIDAYARRAKVSADKLAELMAAETWFTGAEAVEAGLADEVTGSVRVSNSFDLGRFGFRHAPAAPVAAGPSAADLAEHQRRREIAARLVRP